MNDILSNNERISVFTLQGFTIVDFLLAMAIFLIASALAMPFYGAFRDRALQAEGLAELMQMDMAIERFVSFNNFNLPDDLADVGFDGATDPWGGSYEYLRIDGAAGNVSGLVRKDQNMNPLNSDFDLYSPGPDGRSARPITSAASHDDILRASNGGFFGIAETF